MSCAGMRDIGRMMEAEATQKRSGGHALHGMAWDGPGPAAPPALPRFMYIWSTSVVQLFPLVPQPPPAAALSSLRRRLFVLSAPVSPIQSSV